MGETNMIRKSSDEEPFSALAFKVATDPFVGTLGGRVRRSDRPHHHGGKADQQKMGDSRALPLLDYRDIGISATTPWLTTSAGMTRPVQQG